MISDISLVVADDHPLLLSGLVGRLEEYNYNVLATAINGAQALEKIIIYEPSIAILDEEMPFLTGLEVIRKCKDQNLKTKFIILTSHKEKAFVYKAQKLNIAGYLLKDEPFIEIHKAIQSIHDGSTYFSQVFSNILANDVTPQLQRLKLLSPSERTIMKLIAKGKSSRDISDLLSLSIRTVDKHRSNIILKLSLNTNNDNTFALSKWAVDHIELLN